MNSFRRSRSRRRPNRTRAEHKAEARRVRAMSHLQRVRGQEPPKRAPHALFALAVGAALLAGAASGLSLARGSDWLGGDTPPRDVSVAGARHLAALEVATAAGISPDSLAGGVSLSEVERRLEEHSWVAGARALRLPSGRLLLGIEERLPAAIVGAAGADRQLLVDETGTPFADAPAEVDPALPRIVMAETPAPAQPHAEIASAIRLARALPDLGLGPAVEITLAAADDPAGLSLRLEGVSALVLLGRDDLDSKLRELARLLTAGVPEVAEASEIDLRFAEQAVLRNGSPPEEAASSGGRARMRGAVHSKDRPGDPAV
jgi:cell division septal protein FtsQ